MVPCWGSQLLPSQPVPTTSSFPHSPGPQPAPFLRAQPGPTSCPFPHSSAPQPAPSLTARPHTLPLPSQPGPTGSPPSLRARPGPTARPGREGAGRGGTEAARRGRDVAGRRGVGRQVVLPAERSGPGRSGRRGAAMGKVQLFEIRLGESRVVYSPGEPLAGTVTVRLSGSLQYRGEPAACPPPPGLGEPPARLPRAAGPGWDGTGLVGSPSRRCPQPAGPRDDAGAPGTGGAADAPRPWGWSWGGGPRGGAGSRVPSPSPPRPGAGDRVLRGWHLASPPPAMRRCGAGSGGSDGSNLLNYFLLCFPLLFPPIP